MRAALAWGRIRFGLAVGAALSTTWLGVIPAAAVHGVSRTPASSPLWRARYGDAVGGLDWPIGVVTSPDGSKVFVTGYRGDGAQTGDYLTIAYDAVSGVKLWASSYNGPASGQDYPNSIAVSPDGSLVFVTGSSDGGATGLDFATVAYQAGAGTQAWIARYDGPSGLDDTGFGVAVAPDGSRVFVTGAVTTPDGTEDFATVAYESGTGVQAWVTTYDTPGHADDSAFEVRAVGSSVYVLGDTSPGSPQYDYLTAAYQAETGLQQWAVTYDGPGHSADIASDLAVSPDGSAVYVTGYTTNQLDGRDYGTVAYEGTTGSRLWVALYDDQGGSDVGSALTVAPDGTTVFVTGTSGSGSGDYATVAYEAVAGQQQWAARYDGPGHLGDWADQIGISPDGGTLYVSGHVWTQHRSYDYGTVAYNPASGGLVWADLFGRSDEDAATGLAVSPTGSGVFVTGFVNVSGSLNDDWATIAYAP